MVGSLLQQRMRQRKQEKTSNTIQLNIWYVSLNYAQKYYRVVSLTGPKVQDIDHFEINFFATQHTNEGILQPHKLFTQLVTLNLILRSIRQQNRVNYILCYCTQYLQDIVKKVSIKISWFNIFSTQCSDGSQNRLTVYALG